MTLVPGRLEYAAAFDVAAEWLDGFRPPLYAHVSSADLADQVLVRARGPIMLACEDVRTVAHVRRRLAGGLLPSWIADGTRISAGPLPPERPVQDALWASPQRGTWLATLSSLPASARLCVLTATRLGSAARPLRVDHQPGDPSFAAQLERQLHIRGWSIEHRIPIGSFGSLAWAAAGRALNVLGRADLADRAERAHHRAIGRGWGPSYQLLLAGRAGRRWQ